MKTNSQPLLLSVVIPSYNAQEHLPISLSSILNSTIEEQNLLRYFEVIIVNDGSKDDTLKIANEFALKWNVICPGLVVVIDKPNGQYGSTINASLKIARGKFYKVLDADDLFHATSFIELLFIMRGLDENVDVIYTNHVYEKINQNKQVHNNLNKYFEANKVISLRDAKFPKDLITMHSIIYRTKLLLDIKYTQIEKYYYTDSQYSLFPLCFARSMYYINIPLYRYYIGRNDQSINIEVMIKNEAHQQIVLQTLLETINIEKIHYKAIRRYVLLSLRRMVQWKILLIFLDDNIKHKYAEIKKLFEIISNIQKKNNNKILDGALFKIIKFTKGIGFKHILKIGIHLYSKYKLNILDGW